MRIRKVPKKLADSMVNGQPTVPGQKWAEAAADFEPLPGRHRSGQPVMRAKVAEVIRITVLHGR